jgi:hypothetical protein
MWATKEELLAHLDPDLSQVERHVYILECRPSFFWCFL